MKILDRNLWSFAAAGALAAFATLATPARAGVISWGPHDIVETNTATPSAGAINDLYSFSLADVTSLKDRMFIAVVGGMYNMTNGQVSLYRTMSGLDQLIGSFAFPAPGETLHTFSNLSAGNYHYLVTGTATGSAGAMYGFSSVAAPGVFGPAAVPEPQTLVLVLAALAGLAAAARRRGQQAG